MAHGRLAGKALVPGIILWLALMDQNSFVNEILQILGGTTSDEVELAAVYALGLLGHDSAEVRLQLAERLKKPRLKASARAALFGFNSQSAREVILRVAIEEQDTETIINLTQYKDTIDAAVGFLVNRLEELNAKAFALGFGEASHFLHASKDALELILARSQKFRHTLRETAFAHEGRSSIRGLRAAIIEALAIYDADAAFFAAAKALRSERPHDRNAYPPLLARLDKNRARVMFLSTSAEERDESVRRSMGECILVQDQEWLIAQLRSGVTSVRRAACVLGSSIVQESETVLEEVTKLLNDSDDGVAHEAEETLRFANRNHIARELVRHINDDEQEAWVLVDAACKAGHPGFEGGQWPKWAVELGNKVDLKWPAMERVVEEFLGKARKESLRKARDDARKS